MLIHHAVDQPAFTTHWVIELSVHLLYNWTVGHCWTENPSFMSIVQLLTQFSFLVFPPKPWLELQIGFATLKQHQCQIFGVPDVVLNITHTKNLISVLRPLRRVKKLVWEFWGGLSASKGFKVWQAFYSKFGSQICQHHFRPFTSIMCSVDDYNQNQNIIRLTSHSSLYSQIITNVDTKGSGNYNDDVLTLQSTLRELEKKIQV